MAGKKRDPSQEKLISFADPLPVLRKQKDASQCESGGEPLPYPTTKDGKNPWPAIHAERAGKLPPIGG